MQKDVERAMVQNPPEAILYWVVLKHFNYFRYFECTI